MSTFAIATLGCKVNLYESESYVLQLKQLGYTQVDFKQFADIYIINTCAVTNTAASKSRQKIKQAKKMNPNAFVCVVGCYVQTTKEDLDVDVLIGSTQKDRLASFIHEQHRINTVEDLSDSIAFETLAVEGFAKHTRAFLKIQDGCNQYCSYCIIPFARGRERSMPMDEVMKQAKQLIASGHKEIVLSGIHTGRYGNDIQSDLLTLVKELCSLEGLLRLRLSSIEMNELSDAFITYIKQEKKIARHLHIPVQSCCDTTLRAMHRPYTIASFFDKIEMLRKQLGNISISTDLILGFPNESENDYEECLKNFKALSFSFAHIFPYSKRDGTQAALLKNEVSTALKKQRCKTFTQISNEMYENYKASFVGLQVEVLIESTKDNYLYGHTSEYLPVYLRGDQSMLNTMKTVRIVSVFDGILYAELEGDYEVI